MPRAVFLALGVTTYVLYRRHLGLSLTETHKIVLPKPAVEHEVEYESILVPFEDANYSPEAVVTAVRLAARRRRGIHVLVTITVPPMLTGVETSSSGVTITVNVALAVPPLPSETVTLAVNVPAAV